MYIVIGGTLVYGPQSNLQLVPLGLLGNVISTFIWISMILAVGSLSKNTLVSALVAFGFFLALLMAVPIVSAFVGPSASLSYVPGNGATGAINTVQGSVTIGSGTDNIGTNLINYVLYPSANVNFTKMNVEIRVNQQPLITQTLAYTEPVSVVALRSLGVAVTYIFVFLLIALYALKRAQVLE